VLLRLNLGSNLPLRTGQGRRGANFINQRVIGWLAHCVAPPMGKDVLELGGITRSAIRPFRQLGSYQHMRLVKPRSCDPRAPDDRIQSDQFMAVISTRGHLQIAKPLRPRLPAGHEALPIARPQRHCPGYEMHAFCAFKRKSRPYKTDPARSLHFWNERYHCPYGLTARGPRRCLDWGTDR